MGKCDALYQLEGEIEFGEAYFEKATSKHLKVKRGKGSQRQVQVAVMAESTQSRGCILSTSFQNYL